MCQGLVADLVKSGTVSKNEADLILAGALSRSGRTRESIDLVLAHGAKAKDLERALVAAQILLEKGEAAQALDVLDKLPDSAKHRAGILSSMVALCMDLDDRGQAAQLLKSAVRGGGSKSGGDMSVVWRKTAEFHLSGDEPSVAAQSLEELLKMEPNNIQTQAQLVLAYAKFDLSKALAVSRKLPKFAAHDHVVDIEALEDSSFVSTKYGAKAKRPGDPTSPKARAADDEACAEAAKNKKKRKKKKRLPKNPNVEPDPERWLPSDSAPGLHCSSSLVTIFLATLLSIILNSTSTS